MRCHPLLAQRRHEAPHIVVLVSPKRHPPPPGPRADHLEPGLPLGRAAGLSETRRHDQAVAVLHQKVAHEAQLRFLAVPLAKEPRLRIARGGMRVVAPRLTPEVALAIAPRPARPGATLTIFGPVG